MDNIEPKYRSTYYNTCNENNALGGQAVHSTVMFPLASHAVDPVNVKIGSPDEPIFGNFIISVQTRDLCQINSCLIRLINRRTAIIYVASRMRSIIVVAQNAALLINQMLVD